MSSKNGCDGESTENDIAQQELLVGRACNDKDVGRGSSPQADVGLLSGQRCLIHRVLVSFELERCSGLKGDSCVNLHVRADILKDSCSFCLKAAYIWTDLQVQDIKGRIAALKSSQKDATFLVQKYSRGKEMDIPGLGNSNKSSKLESDLMNQWKSLFLQNGDLFGHESSQFVRVTSASQYCHAQRLLRELQDGSIEDYWDAFGQILMCFGIL